VESRYILHPLVAHNTYLQSLVEVGILGSILFFAPVAGALVAFLLAARRFRRLGEEELEFFARTGFAAFIGVLVASFFISEGLAKILWIMVGLGFGLADLYRPQIARAQTR
jgi:O-antigen ligase